MTCCTRDHANVSPFTPPVPPCLSKTNRCVIDSKPHKLDAEAANLLANFAEVVVRQIEKATMNMTAQFAVDQQVGVCVCAWGGGVGWAVLVTGGVLAR